MDARHIDTATECIVSLQAEEMARIHGAARLHVARGLLWVTVEGDFDDHMLGAGESFTLRRGSRGLMQALNAPANVVIVDTAPAWPRRGAAWLQAASRRVADMLVAATARRGAEMQHAVSKRVDATTRRATQTLQVATPFITRTSRAATPHATRTQEAVTRRVPAGQS